MRQTLLLNTVDIKVFLVPTINGLNMIGNCDILVNEKLNRQFGI